LALAGSLSASDPAVAFTTRNSFDCPVRISSFAQSKLYGFEFVTLENDGDAPVSAVELTVTLRTGAGDELAQERRLAVDLKARDAKKVIAELAQVEGLGNKVKSSRQEKGLAILTVKLVEFADGTSWQSKGQIEGVPGLPPPSLPRK
jgi:hypothetical protein